MTRLRMEVDIDAGPEAVWAVLEDIPGQVEWMSEATEIRFLGPQRSGAGTEIECDVRIGPLTTTDVLRFVIWEPPCQMGIEHTGLVSGSGRFTLEPSGNGRTRLVWVEDLRMPLRFGGALGGWLGRRQFRKIFLHDLRLLKRKVEGT
ncbi:MAG: SRPBCC family protein [Actinobacteria bacterium]|nr:SRPBCC family protein [Actinomycetota bacterium]